MKLKNQAIIITGGASGIGYQAGLALATEGANVIVADFNLDGAMKVAAELTGRASRRSRSRSTFRRLPRSRRW